MRPTTEAQAIAWLVDRVPELGPLVAKHLEDYDGELLPYLVFEIDFLQWFIDCVRSGDHERARAFVVALEPLMTTNANPPSSDSVWNLVGVCFAEGLVLADGNDDVVDASRTWMGPNTSADIDQMYRYRNGTITPAD